MTDDSRVDEPGDRTDPTLIRWMLAMTPVERLETLQAAIRSLTSLRELARRDS